MTVARILHQEQSRTWTSADSVEADLYAEHNPAQDMLVMMKTIFGDEVMNAADAAAVQRMEVLAAPARLAGDANDAAQGGVAGSDGADDEDDDGI